MKDNGLGQQTYYSIDVCKWFMAIFVVAIHTHPLANCTSERLLIIYNNVIVMAVPFFFVSSGFLLFRKMEGFYGSEKNLLRIRNYGFKLLKLYLVWTLIYMPLTIYGFATKESSAFYDIALFVRGFLFVGENFYSWPLWYLLSMLFSVTLIYYLLKKAVPKNQILMVSIIVFICGCIMTILVQKTDELTGVSKLISKLIKYSFGSGRLFTGMVYISIGMMIAKHRINIPRIILAIIMVIGILGKAFLPSVLSSLSEIVVITMFFEIVISFSLPDKHIWYWFRKASTVTYFTHMIFFFLYTLLFKQFVYFGIDAFIVSIIVTCCLTIFVLKMENQFQCKWLKYIF